ncbi:hypothetical protein G6F65_021482 [Rhizopus arrhizus]|nr:hypothetical protein G6F65_021482 [Rhizopus arrhizus]
MAAPDHPPQRPGPPDGIPPRRACCAPGGDGHDGHARHGSALPGRPDHLQQHRIPLRDPLQALARALVPEQRREDPPG